MYWFLIYETSKGMKAFGPFEDERDAIDILITVEKVQGATGYFETFPSMERRPDAALREWLREKGG